MDHIADHIAFLGTLHNRTKSLLQLHKRYTKTMLQWPCPFHMTHMRQEHIRKQQNIQAIPDNIIEILLQIQEELRNLWLFCQQRMPYVSYRADKELENTKSHLRADGNHED